MIQQNTSRLEEGMSEVKAEIKEMNADNKKSNKEMNDSLSELKVLVAGEYVPRDEFEKHKDQNEDNHVKLWSGILTLGIFLVGAILTILSIVL